MSNAAPASTFSQGAAEEFMEVLTVTYLGANRLRVLPTTVYPHGYTVVTRRRLR